MFLPTKYFFVLLLKMCYLSILLLVFMTIYAEQYKLTKYWNLKTVLADWLQKNQNSHIFGSDYISNILHLHSGGKQRKGK